MAAQQPCQTMPNKLQQKADAEVNALVRRFVSALAPDIGGSNGETLAKAFHEFLLKDGAERKNAEDLGIILEAPDVMGQVLRPNLGKMVSPSPDDMDPVLQLLNIVVVLHNLNANTLSLMASVLQTRSANEGHVAANILTFLRASNHNMQAFLSQFSGGVAPKSSLLVDTNGSKLN